MDTKNPFRFSLRTLLLAVVAVSVGTAAMVSAAEWWESAVMTITAVLLTLAVLLAGFRSGASRAFWTGFAVCGCAYMLTLIVQIDNRRVADQLLPGKLLFTLVNVMHRVPTYQAVPMSPNATFAPGSTYYAPTLAPAYPAPPTAPSFTLPTLSPIPGPADEPTPAKSATTPADPAGCGAEDVTPDQSSDTPVNDGVYQPVPVSTFPVPANPPMIAPPSVPMTYYATPYGMPVTDDIYLRQQRCLTIGHCLTALLFGMVGGCFAVWLYATRDGCKKVATANAAAPTVNA